MSNHPKTRLVISGKVQGVGFRNFVLLEAQKRKLEGFTRNLRTGEVEVIFRADYKTKKELIATVSYCQWMRHWHKLVLILVGGHGLCGRLILKERK